MQPFASIPVLEDARVLDRPADLLGHAGGLLTRSRRLANALHGVWLGHPLHPALVQLPIGTWASAGLLDALPGLRRLPGGRVAAGVLVTAGLASAGPTAAAGLADVARLHRPQQRVGVAHAAANLLATGLYAGSLGARLRGDHRRGARLGWTGLLVLAVGGLLGGHLAFRQAVGANHAEDAAHLLPRDWRELCRLDELADGRPQLVLLDGTAVFVLRQGARVYALWDKCTHLSGPLHQGMVGEVDGGTCVTCPWHGSTFRVADGAVVDGPATTPQPVLDVRTVDGRVQVRLPSRASTA